jgi:hypothetical protein
LDGSRPRLRRHLLSSRAASRTSTTSPNTTAAIVVSCLKSWLNSRWKGTVPTPFLPGVAVLPAARATTDFRTARDAPP